MEPPKAELDYIRFFCGNTEKPTDLSEHEPQRVQLYKGTASLVRAFANIGDELKATGYSEQQVEHIKSRMTHFVNLRETIRKASGESIDLKAYEADMRHLIDTYIDAAAPKKISKFDDIPLLELIVKTGIADAIASKLGSMEGRKRAIAETIENNVRNKIIKEYLNDPAFFEKMSELLDEVIRARKAEAVDYEKYLKKIAKVVEQVQAGHGPKTPGPLKKSPALRAIFNNLKIPVEDGLVAESDEESEKLQLTIEIDKAVREVKPSNFRGNTARENVIKKALYPILGNDIDEVERIFAIIEKQDEY